MTKKLFKLTTIIGVILLLIISPLIWNELLYFTGWMDKASSTDSVAPVHFYVINLDGQPERFAIFKERTEQFGINIERVSATDGYKVIFVEHGTNQAFTGADIKSRTKEFARKHKYDVYCSPEAYDNKDAPDFVYTAFESIPRGLTAGEIGLDCSSRLLWKKIANETHDQIAVIFEDDTILFEGFNQNFDHFIKALPQKWDIAYLDTYITKLKNYWDPSYYDLKLFKIKKRFLYGARWKLYLPTLTVNKYLTKIHNHTDLVGTHAYAVNKASARKLIEIHDRDISWPIDDVMSRAIKKRTIIAYVANDKIATYDTAMTSEINNMGR